MTSLTPEAASNATGRMPGLWLLVSTLIVAVVLYAGLFWSLVAPSMSGVFICAYFAQYLWAYVGLFASATVFTAALLMSRKLFPKRRYRLQLAVQLSMIAFALAGIILMALVCRFGGQSIEMAGYSLHTRFWLDADRVRAWANSLGPSEDPGAAPLRWPLTLMMMSIPVGRVDVDDIGNVTVYYGSALSGHCGVYITARGKNWTGEHWANGSEYDRIKKIDDGVWIWSSMN